MKYLSLFCLTLCWAVPALSQNLHLSLQVNDTFQSPLNQFNVQYDVSHSQTGSVESGTATTNTFGNVQQLLNSAPDPNLTINLSWVLCNGQTQTQSYPGTASVIDTLVACSPNPSCNPSFDVSPGLGPFDVIISLNSPSLLANYDITTGDGDIYTGQVVSHSYFLPGTYEVCVVGDGSPCVDTVCQWVEVGGPNDCVAGFSSQTTPGSNFTAFNNYSGAGGGASATYRWDFGDGNTDTTVSPSHTYAQAGSYTVCLSMLTNSGCVDTFCQSITVGQTPAQCGVFFLTTVSSGNTYGFDAFPQGGVAPFQFQWDFGDGGSDTVQNAVHTYLTDGAYEICLSIIDAFGCTDTFCDSLWVGSNWNCSAQFSSQLDPGGSLFAYQFSSQGKPNVDYFWDFGNGNTATIPNPTFSFAQPDTYQVCLQTLNNNTGCADTLCQSIIVGAGIPDCFASFAYELYPPQGIQNLALVQFIAPYTEGNISLAWDFGDGTQDFTAFPQHSYLNSGIYTVCLYTTGWNGCQDTFCQDITIDLTQNTCDAAFNVAPQPEEVINFSAIYASDQYHWDFGDGGTDTTANASHAYAAAGSYLVCLVVTDSSGCSDTTCQTVNTTSIVPPGAKDIYGRVRLAAPFTNTAADHFTAWLIAYDSITGTLAAVDTFIGTPTNFGLFYFRGLQGEHLVKVSLDTTSAAYPYTIPTYFGDSLFWHQAQIVDAKTFPVIDINLQIGTNPGGPGFIGGLVLQGANKDEGDPLEGLQVLLTDVSGQPIAHTLTNTAGSYTFDNLAYGTYRIWVEVWGRQLDFHEVVLSANTLTVSGRNFEINDTDVIALTTGLEARAFTSFVQVYPNPVDKQLFLKISQEIVGPLSLQVLSLQGQVLETAVISQQAPLLDVSGLVPGIYFLQIQPAQAGEQVVKFIKR